MSTRPESINDEALAAPRLRKDQRRRISDIIRASETPITALYAVRNFLSTGSSVANLDSDTSPTVIQVSCNDQNAKMSTQYQFKLTAPTRLDSPTL